MRPVRCARIPSLAVIVLAVAGSARSGVLHVPGDHATIQAAVDAAAVGDSVLVGPGTWTGQIRTDQVCGHSSTNSRVVTLKPGVPVISTDGPAVTILDAGSATPYVETVYHCYEGPPALLEGFTVTGGGVGISAFCTSSPLEVRNCVIANNERQGVYASQANVTLRDCEVRGNHPSTEGVRRTAVYAHDSLSFEATGCRFEANHGHAVRASGIGTFLIDGCDFRDHSDGAVSVGSTGTATVRGSLFLRNRTSTGSGKGAALSVSWTPFTIEFNTFAYDSALATYGGAVSVYSTYPARIRNNTFYGCYSPYFAGALAVSIPGATVARNVVASCGEEAMYLSSEDGLSALSGCNILWNNVSDYNEPWPDEAARKDFHVDPHFCDPVMLDFTVTATSPCLPENHVTECPQLVGAQGLGCPSDGNAVVALRTDPSPGPSVSGDAVVYPSPALYDWPAGSSHTAGCDSVQVGEGVRYFFQSWSDGGAPSHSIVVPSSYSELTAAMATEYYLATVVDSGGTVSPGEWTPPGAVRQVLASPHPLREFIGWVGTGSGSYSGLDNPATVTMNGPVTELAVFLPTQYPLVMRANEGGTVQPLSGQRPRAIAVAIEAFPDSGYTFLRWDGVGPGSYTGTANPAQVVMDGPTTQTATFLSESLPLTMNAEIGGTVTPETGPQRRLSLVEIQAFPDEDHAFSHWVGTGLGATNGTDNPAEVRMLEPLEQTAWFDPLLRLLAEEGGTVSPPDGPHDPGTVVPIAATPDARHVFREWKGSGNGSYSGTERLVTVTVNEPILEVAHFDPVAYEVTLSLSNTDPHVHTGDPLGFGNVYLWLDCGTEARGILSARVEVSGTLAPLFFTPVPGVLATGDAHRVELFLSNCTTGPALLGNFTVLPPGRGALCLALTGAAPGTYVESCAANPVQRFSWPADLKVTGVSTDGTTPCSSGRGCDEAPLPGGPVVAAPTVPPVIYADALLGGVPNPFREETWLRFTLSRPGRVRMTVFDVTGRRVDRVLDEDRSAGSYAVRWSGRDASGRVVPAGIYFVRLEADGFTQTRKVARLGVD